MKHLTSRCWCLMAKYLNIYGRVRLLFDYWIVGQHQWGCPSQPILICCSTNFSTAGNAKHRYIIRVEQYWKVASCLVLAGNYDSELSHSVCANSTTRNYRPRGGTLMHDAAVSAPVMFNYTHMALVVCCRCQSLAVTSSQPVHLT